MQFISISLLCQYVKKFTKNIFEKCVYFFIFGKTTKYRRKTQHKMMQKAFPGGGRGLAKRDG